MMNRKALLGVLKKHLTNEIVVSSYSTASDWIEIADRPLNYFSHGAMGLCSSHGLGLALARPERKVVVLDGDGSLLMNLGTLVTLAAAAPRNFLHFVLQNGTYEANGGHPIVNQKVDFCGIARASGCAQVHGFDELGAFEAALPGLLKNDGPAFVRLTIEQGPLGPRSYDEMYRPERREALRRELAKGV
jgi:thiamine pyrophosphate-dependent acetolactate synthase large subunit-like protein